MTDATAAEVETSQKKSKLGLIIGLVLMLSAAFGGFFSVKLGFLDVILTSTSKKKYEDSSKPGFEFVSLEPVTVSLVGSDSIEHLRFKIDIEISPERKSEVEYLIPRMMDIMNGYLRLLEPDDYLDSIALLRIRSQLLSRFQLVAGKDAVKNVLIIEFVVK